VSRAFEPRTWPKERLVMLSGPVGGWGIAGKPLTTADF
jgi:hypothetical protein